MFSGFWAVFLLEMYELLTTPVIQIKNISPEYMSQVMHEVSVVSDLISAILERLERYNIEAVEEVTLVIGELTNLGEEQLEFAYEIITKGTKLEGSKLIIEHEKISVRCNSCGYEGEVKEIRDDYTYHSVPILSCPKCGRDIVVVTGQSCMVKSVKIVEAN